MTEEYERVKEDALLTDEEISIASAVGRERYCKKCLEAKAPTREHEIYEAGDKQVAQAQLDKTLEHKGIRIEADDKSLPKGLTARLNLPDLEHYIYGQEALKETGFVRVLPNKETEE